MPTEPTTHLLEAVAGGTEADAVASIARQTIDPKRLDLGGLYVVATADGKIHTVDLTGDDHRRVINLDPVRKTGHARFTEHASLSSYVVDHGDQRGDSTTLWADRDRGVVVAVLNGHQANTETAGWADHRATLTLRHTPEWVAWTAMSGKLVHQVDFAEFLEDHLGDIREPDGALLLEVATSIQATKGVVMKSAHRLDSGEVKIRFEETIDAKAGSQGDLTIPTRITLGLAPYEGVDPYKITARVRYRLGNGQLTVGFTLDRPEDVIRAAFADIVDQVAAETGYTVFHGTPV